MFRRLIVVYHRVRAKRLSTPTRPRWRLAVEQLECRLAPSATLLSGHLDVIVAPAVPSTMVHVANVMPAASATASLEHNQAVLALMQASHEPIHDQGVIAPLAVPAVDTPPARLLIIDGASADGPLENSLVVVVTPEQAQPEPLDLSALPVADDVSVPQFTTFALVGESDVPTQEREASSIDENHVTYFASTMTESQAQRLDEIASLDELAVAVRVAQPESPAAQASQPMLGWVMGMTCLLMLAWERNFCSVTLSRGKDALARMRKRVTDLARVPA